MRVASYVDPTQRGYAYGLHRDGKRILERYASDKGGTERDRAYREASDGAASLLSTWRLRPDIIRRQVQDNPQDLPGNLYRPEDRG